MTRLTTLTWLAFSLCHNSTTYNVSTICPSPDLLTTHLQPLRVASWKLTSDKPRMYRVFDEKLKIPHGPTVLAVPELQGDGWTVVLIACAGYGPRHISCKSMLHNTNHQSNEHNLNLSLLRPSSLAYRKMDLQCTSRVSLLLRGGKNSSATLGAYVQGQASISCDFPLSAEMLTKTGLQRHVGCFLTHKGCCRILCCCHWTGRHCSHKRAGDRIDQDVNIPAAGHPGQTGGSNGASLHCNM